MKYKLRIGKGNYIKSVAGGFLIAILSPFFVVVAALVTGVAVLTCILAPVFGLLGLIKIDKE
jgi:hypothetical protein